jgi:hypothetical protein
MAERIVQTHVLDRHLQEYRRLRGVKHALASLDNFYLSKGENPPAWVRQYTAKVADEMDKLRAHRVVQEHGED